MKENILDYLSLRAYNNKGVIIRHATNYEFHVVFESLIRHRNVRMKELHSKYIHMFGVYRFADIPRRSLLSYYNGSLHKLKREVRDLLKVRNRRILYALWIHDMKMGCLNDVKMSLELLGYTKDIRSLSLADVNAILQKLRHKRKNLYKNVGYIGVSSKGSIFDRDVSASKQHSGYMPGRTM